LNYYDGTLNELWQVSTRYQQLALHLDLPMAEAWARFGMAWSLYHSAKPPQEVLNTLLPVFDRLQAVHLATVIMMLPVLVAAAVELGRLDVAAQALDKARRVALERENLFALDQISAGSALIALHTQDRNSALVWAVDFLAIRSRTMADRADMSPWGPQVFVCARILVAWGTKAQVLEIMQPLQMLVESARSRGFVVEILEGVMRLACCCWRSDQPLKALEWMRQALELGIPRGYRRLFFDQGTDAIKILRTLAQRGVCVEDISKLLAEYADWLVSLQRSQPPVRKAADAGVMQLTQREEDVLLLLAQQLSNKEIARRLNISAITVRNHTSSIYSKLNVTSRKTAVARAKALQLLP
jgi:ATP/maltotriose-dependent transcriptional regulator MalT